MSNSRKRQKARERAQSAEHIVNNAAAVTPEKTLSLDPALYDRIVLAVTGAGEMVEEGDRLCYLYNGETLAIKYTEPGETETQPARLLVAAFRQGVVLQTEGERVVRYQPGDWELRLDSVTPPPEDEFEENIDVTDGPNDVDGAV